MVAELPQADGRCGLRVVGKYHRPNPPKPAASMQPQLAPADDVFASALAHFSSSCDWLRGEAMDLAHGDVESYVLLSSREVARRMLQAHLDLRAHKERNAPRPTRVADHAVPRTQACNLDTVVGRVRVQRWAWQCKGAPTVRPLDEALNLPREVYSAGVRRFVCEQLADRSVGRCTEALHAMGIEVPRRQAEQLAVRMAQDYDAFYKTREHPANDTADDATLLVLSVDAKGVRMVPRALREATRKAAAHEATQVLKGDPMADRQERPHDRRMAVVTAIWDQGRCVRTAEQVAEQLKPPSQRALPKCTLPRPQHKRVAATLAQDQVAAVREMFAEAQRRDPEHRRTWVVLLDGAETQSEVVQREADRLGVRVVIVLDLLHVLHYLWQAAIAIHGGTNAAAQEWVRTYVYKLLTRPVVDVAAGIRQSATLRKVRGAKRAAVEKCVAYLRARGPQVDYAAALREGLPIASGVIEGACRSLVQDRMGITGARWTVEGAEAVLRIRALQASGDWDAYCRFHFTKEHARNYSPTKAAA